MQVSHHNHGKHTLEVGVEVIKHQRALRMQSFNNYRKRFGLEPYKSFEEMTGEWTYLHVHACMHAGALAGF